MSNPMNVPGITVQTLAQKRAEGHDFVLMDVREERELMLADLGDGVTVVPMSQLSYEQEAALPDEVRDNKECEIVVMCHTGNRSSQVAAWLRGNGYSNVWNLDGGIEAYAVEVDPSVGRY